MFGRAKGSKCPNCGHSLSSDQYDCPACGTNVREKPEPRPNVNVKNTNTNIKVVKNSKGQKEESFIKIAIGTILLIGFMFGGIKLMESNTDKRSAEEKEKFYSEVNRLVDGIREDISNGNLDDAEILLVQLKNVNSSWTSSHDAYRDEMYDLMLKRYEDAQKQN